MDSLALAYAVRRFERQDNGPGTVGKDPGIRSGQAQPLGAAVHKAGAVRDDGAPGIAVAFAIGCSFAMLPVGTPTCFGP
jgi:hypothetical protein